LRKKIVKPEKSFDEELEEFGKKLLSSFNKEFDNGEKPNTGSMYAFAKLLPLIQKNSKNKKREANLDQEK